MIACSEVFSIDTSVAHKEGKRTRLQSDEPNKGKCEDSPSYKVEPSLGAWIQETMIARQG